MDNAYIGPDLGEMFPKGDAFLSGVGMRHLPEEARAYLIGLRKKVDEGKLTHESYIQEGMKYFSERPKIVNEIKSNILSENIESSRSLNSPSPW